MRVDQAAGGTNRPGVPAEVFAMSPGRRMRYDVPAPGLADCVTGYAIYISDNREPMHNWFLPAPPMIVILLDAGPVSARFRNADVAAIPRAGVWGPASHAFRLTTRGGISVGIGLSAEGWARLTARSALLLRDRVTPLSRLVPPDAAAQLVGALEALGDDADIAPTLDGLLPGLFTRTPPALDRIRALGHMVLSDDPCGVAEMAERLDVDTRALRRIATENFGMPPKSLLLRARFIRSFSRWMMHGEPPSYEGIDASYFDTSHFLQDAAKYLGTTPRRFARLELDYMRTSLRARAAVLGAAQHSLHATPPEEEAVPLTLQPAQ